MNCVLCLKDYAMFADKKFIFQQVLKIKLTGFEDWCSKVIIKEDEKLMNTFQLFPLKLTIAAHSR